MKTMAMAAVLAAVQAVSAHAGQTAMSQSVEAGVLHTGNIDMVAYWTPVEDDAVELTATFQARRPDAEPMRLIMPLKDGDGLTFALPGEPMMTYSVSRNGSQVSIMASSPSYRISQN